MTSYQLVLTELPTESRAALRASLLTDRAEFAKVDSFIPPDLDSPDVQRHDIVAHSARFETVSHLQKHLETLGCTSCILESRTGLRRALATGRLSAAHPRSAARAGRRAALLIAAVLALGLAGFLLLPSEAPTEMPADPTGRQPELPALAGEGGPTESRPEANENRLSGVVDHDRGTDGRRSEDATGEIADPSILSTAPAVAPAVGPGEAPTPSGDTPVADVDNEPPPPGRPPSRCLSIAGRYEQLLCRLEERDEVVFAGSPREPEVVAPRQIPRLAPEGDDE